MPLPPPGDPQRPFHLAIRSARLLGIVFLLIGSLAIFAVTIIPSRSPARLFIILGALVWLTPGVLYAVFSAFLKRRREWAIIALIVLASIHGLFALILTIVAIVAANVIGIGVCLLWVLALAQLIQHLSKSFAAIRLLPMQAPGFEPILLAPAAAAQPPPLTSPQDKPT
jgi:hypothetical protein